MRPFSIVVAAAENGGIGKDNKLPWRLKYVRACWGLLLCRIAPCLGMDMRRIRSCGCGLGLSQGCSDTGI